MNSAIEPQQTSFLESILDPRVRRFRDARGLFVSILDVLEIHANKKDPSDSWKKTLAWMVDKQGFTPSSVVLTEHQFEGQGQRKTPVIHEDLFYRILQSADVPEWEPIRLWGAALMKREADPTQQARLKYDQDVTAYVRAGYTAQWAQARLEAKASQNIVKGDMKATHVTHDPNYGLIFSQQNVALFSMSKQRIVEVLGLNEKQADKYREHLGEYAQRAIDMANRIASGRMRNEHRALTDDELLTVVLQAATIAARAMKEAAAFVGEDYLTGSDMPAIPQGKQLALKPGSTR